MWLIFLYTLLVVLPIGLLLRFYASHRYGFHGDWTKYSGVYFEVLKEKDRPLYYLLCIEGLISNLALLGLLISIPLHFLFGI